MNWRYRRSVLLGFLGGTVVIAGLLWLVDVDAVLGALARADPLFVIVILGLAICWLVTWGLTLRTVLASLDISLSTRTAFLVYTAVVFANNITPFGFAGGQALSAFIVSSAGDTEYETGLASIASVDVLNAVSAFSLLVLGLGIYTSLFTIGTGLRSVVGSVVLIALAIPVLLVLAWRYRAGLVDRIAGPVAAVLDRLASVGGERGPITRADVATRLWRLVGSIERIAADRRGLAAALTFSALGWFLQAVALVVAFAALGREVSLVVALFVVPLANLAGMTPLPGGLGGIEAAFVALLVPTTGVEAAVVTAAVLLFRAAIYWLPVIIGGMSATVFGGRLRAS